MSEVKKLADWKSIVEYSPEGPKHQVLVDTGSYRAVLVGIEAGGKIPPHPSTDATYHFLEGSGWMIVDGERYPVTTGTTMVVPAQAERGIEAETRLAFLGSHGGHGAETSHRHSQATPKSRRPMVMFGLMALSMVVLMVGLWQIGASPMAMMFSGLSGMESGIWSAMLLPMLGLLGMLAVMFLMVRTMTGMGRMTMGHDHATMVARKELPAEKRAEVHQVSFSIPAISCGGCKQTIEQRIGELEGVATVAVDVNRKQAVIGFEAPATAEGIKQYLAEIGYPVVPA